VEQLQSVLTEKHKGERPYGKTLLSIFLGETKCTNSSEKGPIFHVRLYMIIRANPVYLCLYGVDDCDDYYLAMYLKFLPTPTVQYMDTIANFETDLCFLCQCRRRDWVKS
jgi:hypothetical protein